MHKKPIKILLAGDYHTYGVFDNFIKHNPNHDLFCDNLKNVVNTSDFSVFNLEDPLTDKRNGIIKYGPYGVGSKESLVPIKEIGFNLATFATNHTYDMKNKGIQDTFQACLNQGIEVTGAGLTKNEARKIYYKELGEYTFAILNFARKEFNTASDTHGGSNPLDVIDNTIDIRNAKAHADIVIVVVHEGLDVFHLPYPELVKQMRFYADMGADAIFIHHSRLISGYEVYNGVPIFYGLGNLLHMSKIKEEHEGLIVELNINENREIRFVLHPILLDIKNVRVYLAQGDKKKEIINKINLYSETISNDDLLKQEWSHFVLAKKGQYLNIASGWPSILYRIAKKIKLLRIYNILLLINKRKYLAIWNIARCQAHFEAFNHILTDVFKDKEK